LKFAYTSPTAESGGQTAQQRRAYIRGMHGKFKGSTFSSKQLFENRRRDRENKSAHTRFLNGGYTVYKDFGD
jgi:hypothetical protein